MRCHLVLSMLILLIAGCNEESETSSATVDSAGLVGRNTEYSLPAMPADLLKGLPKNPDTGNPVVLQVQGLSLEYDVSQKDQLTAVAACTGWIATCFKPGEREIDDCARSAPVCATSTPWLESAACCPAACFERYSAARTAGRPAAVAIIEKYVDDRSCFPPDGKTAKSSVR
jgi:hypothetical protein